MTLINRATVSSSNHAHTANTRRLETSSPTLDRLFPERLDECNPFKTDTYKFKYPDNPFKGAVVQVDRRIHTGNGIKRIARKLSTCTIGGLQRDSAQYTGEKIHLSANHHQLLATYKSISDSLFDDLNPFDSFKIINPAYSDPNKRVGAGAQFTFYIHEETDHFLAKQFLQRIGELLRNAGIGAGTIPKSDASLENIGDYFSYRSEWKSERHGVSTLHQESEEFYQALLN